MTAEPLPMCHKEDPRHAYAECAEKELDLARNSSYENARVSHIGMAQVYATLALAFSDHRGITDAD